MAEATSIFTLAESLGRSGIADRGPCGHDASLRRPAPRWRLTPGLVRLSVGIGKHEDLIADFEQALEARSYKQHARAEGRGVQVHCLTESKSSVRSMGRLQAPTPNGREWQPGSHRHPGWRRSDNPVRSIKQVIADLLSRQADHPHRVSLMRSSPKDSPWGLRQSVMPSVKSRSSGTRGQVMNALVDQMIVSHKPSAIPGL